MLCLSGCLVVCVCFLSRLWGEVRLFIPESNVSAYDLEYGTSLWKREGPTNEQEKNMYGRIEKWKNDKLDKKK